MAAGCLSESRAPCCPTLNPTPADGKNKSCGMVRKMELSGEGGLSIGTPLASLQMPPEGPLILPSTPSIETAN